MINSNNSFFKLAWLSCAVVLAVAGCSDSPRTPSSPSAPSIPSTAIGVIGKAAGLLRGEQPTGRFARPHPVLANATVTVIGGPASGASTTTREDGTYEVTASGTFKLRFAHPMFTTRETEETVMTADGVAIPEVTLLTAPWSISGRITDSLGHPVADVDISASGSEFDAAYGTTRSDADGRYTLNSTRPHFASMYVAAVKPGFVPLFENRVECCGAAPDIHLVRIVSITPTAPTYMRVGQSIEMPASSVVFDTGETRNIFVLPTSSLTSVVLVNRSEVWYAMRGLRAGTATLTFDLWGAVATRQVLVE